MFKEVKYVYLIIIAISLASCNNSKTSELADLKVNHPELWNELKLLSQEKNIIADKFRYTKTFQYIENEVDAYIQERENQIKIEVTENE